MTIGYTGLRAEWVISRSRAERWEEEVVLLKAEMSRVLSNLVSKAKWWRTRPRRVSAEHVHDSTLLRGLAAYAEKQAAVFEALSINFSSYWCQVFLDNDLKVPKQWPAHLCVVRNLTRNVVKRRERTNLRKQAKEFAAKNTVVQPSNTDHSSTGQLLQQQIPPNDAPPITTA